MTTIASYNIPYHNWFASGISNSQIHVESARQIRHHGEQICYQREKLTSINVYNNCNQFSFQVNTMSILYSYAKYFRPSFDIKFQLFTKLKNHTYLHMF